LKLLKEEVITLLRLRGIEHSKKETKSALVEKLVRHAFDGDPQADIEAIVRLNTAAPKAQEDRIIEELSKDTNLSMAVDALQSMDPDTAQAFPEMVKAQKLMRNPAYRKLLAKEASAKADDDDAKPRKPRKPRQPRKPSNRSSQPSGPDVCDDDDDAESSSSSSDDSGDDPEDDHTSQYTGGSTLV
jgi:hypothetical protein